MNRFNTLLALVVAAVFSLVAVIGPRMLISGMRVPLLRSAAEAGLQRYEEVEFSPPDQPISLRGWWLAASDARGAVVILHGGGANRADPWARLPELGADLQTRGFHALLFDMRNHGESDASADGLPAFGPAEASDVLGAIDFIERRVSHLPIAVIGFSVGGSAAIYAAARDARIRAVVTTDTYAEIASVLPAAVAASSGMPEWLARVVLWFLEHLHGAPISRARAIDVAPRLEPSELLVIHNEADPIVPIGHAWLLATAAPEATLWITAAPENGAAEAPPPWGTHARSYSLYPGEYVDRVVAHFQMRFAAASGPPRESVQGSGH